MVLEKTLESPLEFKEIQPVHPRAISPGCSLEGLMLKLKLQYFGHLMWRADSFEKTLMLGKIDGWRRRGWGWDGWMAPSTQWTWVWVDSRSWWWTGRPGVLWLMGCQSRTQLSDWTELPVIVFVFNKIWPALNIINYKMFPIQTNPYRGVWSFENKVGEFSSICKGVWRRRNQKNKKVITGFSCVYFFLFFFFPFIFISWRLITLQYCSGSCHILTWISHGFTCIPHPNPPSQLPPHVIPLGLPSAPAPSTCLRHPTWAGDLFHPWEYTCFNAVLSKHPTLAFSHRVQKSVLYICVSFSVLHLGLSLPSS